MVQRKIIQWRKNQVKIDRFILDKQKFIDSKLIELVGDLQAPGHLKKAFDYAIKAGGKRLRPILMMSTYEGFSNSIDKVTHPALALEFIHTYSLIHDDLPAMDDDDLRRGQPTLHREFVSHRNISWRWSTDVCLSIDFLFTEPGSRGKNICHSTIEPSKRH